LELYF